jgi:hypothetical protein
MKSSATLELKLPVRTKSRAMDFLDLTKPRISAMVLFRSLLAVFTLAQEVLNFLSF